MRERGYRAPRTNNSRLAKNAAKSFAEKCYAAISKVPAGKVTTYGEIARYLRSRGFRAVGKAMHDNPHAPEVPCHRVVRSDGSLGGYNGGLPKKIALLRSEGVAVSDGRVRNFDQCFYRFKGSF